MGRKPLGNYILLHISMIIVILGEKKETQRTGHLNESHNQ